MKVKRKKKSYREGFKRFVEKEAPEFMLLPSGEKESGLQGKYSRRTFLGLKVRRQSADMKGINPFFLESV